MNKKAFKITEKKLFFFNSVLMTPLLFIKLFIHSINSCICICFAFATSSVVLKIIFAYIKNFTYKKIIDKNTIAYIPNFYHLCIHPLVLSIKSNLFRWEKLI